MRYNPKAKLKVRQIKDLRDQTGAVQRRRENFIPDGAEKPPSVEQAQDDERHRRWGQTVYSKPYQPVGHVRYDTPKMVRHGNIAIRENVPERPDGADRTQPFKNKHKGVIARDQAHPKKLRVKRTGTSH